MRFFIITIFLILCSGLIKAQELPYRVVFLDGLYNELSQIKGQSDSASFSLELIKIKNELYSKGHLLANVDKYIVQDSLLATINVGPIYFWHSMGVENIPEEYLSKSGYRMRDFQNREISPVDFRKLLKKLLDQATNSGYPFASFQLTDLEVLKRSVRGKLAYQPGPQIKYDTLTLTPTNLVKAGFLESYLNLRQDDLFMFQNVTSIESKLERLPYVNLTDSVRIRFENNLCNISFGLKKKKSNKFDAIIGFLPNQNSNGGLRITGYADLHLDNLFRAGKSLTFKWQQFQNASQKLNLAYDHPNILRSQLGFGLKANIIKQDTSFLNTDFSFSLFYQNNDLQLSLDSDIISARQLSTPSDTTIIPVIGDYNMNLFGLNIIYDRIRNDPNPRYGFQVSGSAKLGGKNIKKNTALPEEVYDSLMLSSTQLQVSAGFELNTSISNNLVFHTEFSAGAILNNDRLFVNDLMRLGGVNSLRGFNDFDLFVSSYGLARLELRLIMNEYSRLFLFYDQALTSNVITQQSDAPLGFGAGIYLRTGGGDLQLVYALGVSQEQSLSLDQSKIHIGYVATF